MARLSRLVLPGYPYHVTQRGNRRSQTFFGDGDYELYRDRPLGNAAWIAGLEARTGWTMASRKRGPKLRVSAN